MPSERAFDVVVFGATGFTGGLVAEYLARSGARGARWAIAGRSETKLGRVRERCRAISGQAPEMLIADVADPESLRRMAAHAHVVLSTVGPFARYGEPVVEACVDARSDYVDITGEPAWVATMIRRFDRPARDSGTRLVPCCGFDSIPHDLGAQFAVEQLPSNQAITVRAVVRASGGISVGTGSSTLDAFADVDETAGAVRTIVESAELLGKRSVELLPMAVHREMQVDAWGVPLPTIDPAIVLRSARMLDTYGPSFRYGHFARVERFASVVGGVAGVGALVALARNPAIREQLRTLRAPGEGPTEEQRRRGSFEVDFLAESQSGKRARVRVAGGEPGYHETSKMVAESALCLALDRADTPSRHGVLTTAVAMGATLRAHLVRAGLRFEVVA